MPMFLATSMTSRAAAVSTRPTSSQKRFKLPVAGLRIGVFVAELDRPWLDTPFLIQGFLVDSEIELSTLRKYCQYVLVDLELSTTEVAEALRRHPMADGDGDAAFEDTVAKEDEATAPGMSGPASLDRRDASADRPMARALRENREAPQDERNGRRGDGSDKAAPEEHDALDDDTRGGHAGTSPDTGTGSDARKSTPAPRAPQRTYRIRSDVRISSDTRDRFRQLVRGLPLDATDDDEPSLAQRALSGLRSLLGGRSADGHGAAEQPGGKPRGSIPDSELPGCPGAPGWKTYVDRVSVGDELPRARQAMARSEETLASVVADIRGGRIPQTGQVNEVVDHMVDSMIDNPDALLWVAQLREEHLQTYQHGVRVALYMIAMGRQLGFPRELLGNLGMIGMLADVGKIKLPRALLEKPGMLNPAEYSIIKEHVRLGLESLAQGGNFPAEVELGIAQHHERLDGSGYPKGMKGNEISIYGRMAAIADSFSALITPRPYANPLAPQDALMSLYQWAGSSFHGPLVEQFVQGVGVFPVGSMVELSSGEVAVVLAQNRVRRLEPRVLLLTAPDKRPLPAPVEKNLLNQACEDASTPLRIVRGLPSGAYGLKLRDYYADELAAANKLV